MDWKQRVTALIVALAAMLTALACTSAATKAAPPKACFDVSRVRSFSPLDPKFVYVQVGTDEHYLLTMDSVYPSLPFAVGITISNPGTSFSRVCSDTGARLTYLEAGHRVYARIIAVDAVSSRKAAEKLVARRNAPPAKE